MIDLGVIGTHWKELDLQRCNYAPTICPTEPASGLCTLDRVSPAGLFFGGQQ